MILEVYEMSNGRITGYKVYEGGIQMGTLEFRDYLWIAGILIDSSIRTQSTPDFKKAYNWINKTLDENQIA